MERRPEMAQGGRSPGARDHRLPIVPITASLMAASFDGMGLVRDVRGHIPSFLTLYGVAYLAYGVAVWWSHHWHVVWLGQRFCLTQQVVPRWVSWCFTGRDV